jgi:hypothetical protein
MFPRQTKRTETGSTFGEAMLHRWAGVELKMMVAMRKRCG